MDELEILEKERDKWLDICRKYSKERGCGIPTEFTMGCGECAISRRFRNASNKLSEFKEICEE